jgi:hypothetical protein
MDTETLEETKFLPRVPNVTFSVHVGVSPMRPDDAELAAVWDDYARTMEEIGAMAAERDRLGAFRSFGSVGEQLEADARRAEIAKLLPASHARLEVLTRRSHEVEQRRRAARDERVRDGERRRMRYNELLNAYPARLAELRRTYESTRNSPAHVREWARVDLREVEILNEGLRSGVESPAELTRALMVTRAARFEAKARLRRRHWDAFGVLLDTLEEGRDELMRAHAITTDELAAEVEHLTGSEKRSENAA